MLNPYTPEGRPTPPGYDPEEPSWLTGIPDPLPDDDDEEIGHFRRLARIDAKLDFIIDRLIALRDELDATTEGLEGRSDDDMDVEDDYGRGGARLGSEMPDEEAVDPEYPEEDREEDDHGGGNVEDRGEPSLGWSDNVSQGQGAIAAGYSPYPEGDEAEPEDLEDDNQDQEDWDFAPGDDPKLDAQARLAHRGKWKPSRLFPAVQP